MDLKLTNDVAVVIGGAQGIGGAIAAEFAAEGCMVAILDRSERVDAAAAELSRRSGARVWSRCLDATDERAMRAAADAIVAELGGADHVVYAAGMGSGKFGFPFWNLSPSDWGPVLNVNLVGAVVAAQAFVEPLRSSPHGTLLFLSSVAAQIGSQTDPPYSAAKAGVLNFTHCAAKDLAPHGVRVNAICPGMVRTELNESVWRAWHDSRPLEERKSYDAWAAEKIRQVAPLGRWQTPEEIAAVAVFLASPRAANITGQVWNVDGGQVMHW